MIKAKLSTIASTAICLGAILFHHCTYAEQRYISDELRVPLRSGMGNEYRIVHRGLASGSQLELLQTDTDDSETEWSQVRTNGGLEGWVRSQYLLAEPTAAIKLAKLESKMAQLDGDQTQLLDTNETLEQENTLLQSQLAELNTQYNNIQREFDALQKLSANAVALNEQNKKLSESHQLLQTRAEVLKTENHRLMTSQTYQQWIYGAGILIAGIALSFFLQAFGRRKRRSEWG
ncbi:TIGR04211 family SH3 domain-containing protein [Gilvimarinus sp. SDUM040013]|uniref:TIGR04211 family SH3 domain-containing protein n=1 Tax=Gilvimarinus gilvus TaxID=3058038 RepID=A0ABU4RXU3_9GAMM|nr:TIGR04211 family SH3 domain-containing protein [Gilvimarinus sp. SDUM040013]MDO3386422.1 TIGR04211 family SH3 domain-containing protein [Gilvimarinus sp. SDUM040013]MDX6849688.1 TIGR04211 family SH3 domain-containing protein [Gilvimarinus sp. SDUM040013]